MSKFNIDLNHRIFARAKALRFLIHAYLAGQGITIVISGIPQEGESFTALGTREILEEVEKKDEPSKPPVQQQAPSAETQHPLDRTHHQCW